MKNVSSRFFIICVLVSIGIFLRILIASFGYTYDIQSYQIVGKIVTSGGNVYQETSRYNYGPVWFTVLGVFYSFSHFFSDGFLIFRFCIVIFLTIADLGIWYVLYKKYSIFVSFLFFLNPLSVILTGYYSQFDNLAVLLGMISIVLYERSIVKKSDKNYWLALIVLSFSLMTKHIFFAFPLWLGLKETDLKKRLFIFIVPTCLFLLSFLPFIQDGYDGIKQNVFLYKSFNNAPLWQFIVPDYLKRYLRKEFLFFGTLVIGAFIFRKKKPFELLLLYCCVLVTFSYAIADQYIAIILPFVAVYLNVFFVLFTFVQSLFFLMILQGGEVMWLGFFLDRSSFGFSLQMLLLFLGLVFILYRMKYPQIRLAHINTVLFILVIILYFGNLLPSWQEDRKIAPITTAIREGNYEEANNLYHLIEINPPFAGSRFYEKLRFVRFNIEFYRNYRSALDAFMDTSKQKNWKKVKKDLQIIPGDFQEKEKVKEILIYSEKQI